MADNFCKEFEVEMTKKSLLSLYEVPLTIIFGSSTIYIEKFVILRL